MPRTDWQPRPTAEVIRLHDEAILGQRWVIDGNYSLYLESRLARATGLIFLDTPTLVSLFRLFRRAWFERDMAGAIAGGASSSVRLAMIRHIVVKTPANRARNREIFDRSQLPKVRLATRLERAHFYRSEGLTRS